MIVENKKEKRRKNLKRKIYVCIIEYIGNEPCGNKYYDLYGPSNGYIGQYPSFQQAKDVALSCARNKGYNLKEVFVYLNENQA